MSDLFAPHVPKDVEARRPLADRLRPKTLAEVTGQEHLTGEDGVLARMIASGSLGSMIFWGPPGTGKTTVARLLSGEAGLAFEQISAIFSGVADLKKVFEAARMRRMDGRQTLLFVDEIHRFNRAQQDGFLPVMEDGTVILVGATTENPSFELNAALLSRARVLTFKPHDEESLGTLLKRAEEVEGKPLPLDADARASLIRMADGDGRAVLTLAEEVWRAAREGEVFDTEGLTRIVQRRAPVYDKGQDGHYNLISALHKSVRGSDPDAALYYLCRMFDAGEDPLYLGRRLVRMAVEDIGLADPQALVICNAAKDAYDYLGSPEETGAGPGLRLSRHRTQVERRLHGLQGGDARRQGERLAAAAEAYPQCPHQADEGGRLQRRLSLRPRRTGRLFRPGLFPREDGPQDLLRSAGTGVRARDPQAAGLVGEAQARAGRLTPGLRTPWPLPARRSS
jgi:putative ATPase